MTMYFVRLVVLATAALALPAQTIVKRSLDAEGARRVLAAFSAQAAKLHTTGVAAVVDDGGNLMALQRIDGTFAAGANISIGKARTAALFKKPTRVFEDIVAKGRTSMVALNDFTPLQGGVPIVMDEQIVGAIGVSGAASAAQDEELAMAGAAAIHSRPDSVSFFERQKVEEAFAKGSVLFNENQRYMVHASRREMAGAAEIHNEDADIIYVLDGTATIVTGGTAVDAKSVAPGELRGTAINGGESRELHKGDVLIVPAGTPHWFKEVTNPFLYYVVKAR
jgi:glc operon protein GlcG